VTAGPWLELSRPDWLVVPGFDYVGPIGFDLHGARVVRHHYVDAAAGGLRRQLIAQLEAFPADSGRHYRWQVEHPLRLGGLEHEHGVYAWGVAAFTRADPEAEVARTARFLAEHDYAQGDGQLMSRFARVVGEARQREVIVFYQEDLAQLGLRLDEIADEEGNLRPETAELADEVTARSLAAFKVVDDLYAMLGREV
jgi:hypothetical protein